MKSTAKRRASTQKACRIPSVVGIGFPYFVDDEKFPPFGRERILWPAQRFIEHYEQQDEKPPKCLSPSKKALQREARQSGKAEASSHLYILEAEAQKLNSPATIAAIVEGEAKTLALAQDLRSIEPETGERFAAVGISGVDQLLPAPESRSISWKNRMVYLFFDADSIRNPNVARARDQGGGVPADERGRGASCPASGRRKPGTAMMICRSRRSRTGFPAPLSC